MITPAIVPVEPYTPEAKLYLELSDVSLQTIDIIPFSNVGQRYFDVMGAKLAQLQPHRREMARLFSDAMQAEEPQGIFPADTMHKVFVTTVQQSTDAPSRPDDVTALADLMYALYLLSVLFWLYDRTPQQAATAHLLDFTREMIRLLRPMMIMPLFSKALAKVSTITRMVFHTPVLG